MSINRDNEIEGGEIPEKSITIMRNIPDSFKNHFESKAFLPNRSTTGLMLNTKFLLQEDRGLMMGFPE
jgi:hypothetical protein